MLELEHHPPRALGRLEGEASDLPSRGSRSMRSILSSFFTRDCAWRARVPARKRSTKRSRRAISACWRSIARPSASSREAFSLRQACQVPLKKRLRPASSSSTAVPTASRNQRSWATSTTAASSDCRWLSSHSSEAMSRWLVGSSSSSRSGSPASARASDARVSSPPENVRRLRSRASSRKPSPCRVALTASRQLAAGVLQPGLSRGVRVERRGVRRAVGHPGPRARSGAPRVRAGPCSPTARSRAG